MRQIELIKQQLGKDLLPHAYLFSGADEASKKLACELIFTSLLGKKFYQHPDFYAIRAQPISIDDIRAMKMRAFARPFIGAKSVFFLESIEYLSREAAAALLKILEEPPPYAFIFATTSHSNLILPTILSRFSRLHFFTSSARSPRATYTVRDINRMEREVRATLGLTDSTINKRLVEEYLMMIK